MKPGSNKFSRRKLLGGAAAAGATIPVLHELVPHQSLHNGNAAASEHLAHRASHNRASGHIGSQGSVDPRVNGFDPQEILRDFDEGTLVDGVREWEIVAREKEIEVAPGVKYLAWTYNDRVPGPTLRAREGERMRVKFVNGSTHPHTMHFHGIHRDLMDGDPRHRRRQHRAGAPDRLRVRRQLRSACTSTTATRRRSRSTSPRASTARW